MPRSQSAIRPRALVGAVLCALAFARCGGTTAAPDVLILVLDTVRADHLSVFGYQRATAPALARFAEESIVFEDAWGPASWTLPAHAALFTGMRPSDVGLGEGANMTIETDAPLLAERLQSAGWATGCFTANLWIAPHTGATRGFDVVEALHADPGGTWAARTHARALDWMRERRARGERFFAFVNDMEAHAPWTPRQEFRKRFVRPGHDRRILERLANHSILDVPDGGILIEPDYPGVRETARDLYDGELGGLDSEVGRLIDRMREEGLLENTLVVILSDHGEGLGDHGWMEHGFSLHREILRIPLLVRLPDGATAKRVSDVVRLRDVLPTVLDVCGLKSPAGLQGASLLESTEGRIATARMRIPPEVIPRTEAVLGTERAELAHRVQSSIYDGRWHLLSDDAGRIELYDVTVDPAELVNVAADHPDEVERLRALAE